MRIFLRAGHALLDGLAEQRQMEATQEAVAEVAAVRARRAAATEEQNAFRGVFSRRMRQHRQQRPSHEAAELPEAPQPHREGEEAEDEGGEEPAAVARPPTALDAAAGTEASAPAAGTNATTHVPTTTTTTLSQQIRPDATDPLVDPSAFLQLLPHLNGRRARAAASSPVLALQQKQPPHHQQQQPQQPLRRPSSQPSSHPASRIPTPPPSRGSSRHASPRPASLLLAPAEKKGAPFGSLSSAAAARSAARIETAPRTLAPPTEGSFGLAAALAGEVEMNLNGTYQSGGYRSPPQDVGLTEALI